MMLAPKTKKKEKKKINERCHNERALLPETEAGRLRCTVEIGKRKKTVTWEGKRDQRESRRWRSGDGVRK